MLAVAACGGGHSAPVPIDSTTYIPLAEQRSITIATSKLGSWTLYETGPSSAGLPLRAKYADLVNHGLIADFVRLVSPDHSAPAAVVALQARVGVPRDVQLPRIAEPPPSSFQSAGGTGPKIDTVSQSCPNSCCDENYVANLFANLGDTDWEYIDYGYSNRWADNVHHWNSTVCPAQGASLLYYGNQDGSGGTYQCDEGNYCTLDWQGAGTCDGIDFCQADKIMTFVNDQNHPHWHSYGGFAHPF
jgi:hypothetical protein